MGEVAHRVGADPRRDGHVGVIELKHDAAGETTGALIPETAPDSSWLGKAPNESPRGPSGGRVGAPAVSREFLQEIAVVHRIGAKNGLGKMKTFMRYMEVRAEAGVSEKRIIRYLSECRSLGLLPRGRSLSAST